MGTERRITQAIAKKVLWKMYETGKDSLQIIEENDWWELSPEETEKVVDKVIAENPKAVRDYRGR